MINYDLHWNPTRMVQRAGRIDRIGSEFEQIAIYNMFPDEGLEALLGIVESLSRRLPTSTPPVFWMRVCWARRCTHVTSTRCAASETKTALLSKSKSSLMELASSEFMLQQLKSLLASGAQERLDALPDGIHSGLQRSNYRGLFFYFTVPDPSGADASAFLALLRSTNRQILDNRFVIASLIAAPVHAACHRRCGCVCHSSQSAGSYPGSNQRTNRRGSSAGNR